MSTYYRTLAGISGQANTFIILANTESVGATTEVSLTFEGDVNTSFTAIWNSTDSNIITHTGTADTITHDYGTVGLQYIKIQDNMGHMVNGTANNSQILELKNYGNDVVLTANQSSTFEGATNMVVRANDYPKFIAGTNCEKYFKGCVNMERFSKGSWPTSTTANITSMASMFQDANSFTGAGIEDWDTTNVTTLQECFYNVQSFNANLSLWNVSNVTNLYRTFNNTSSFSGDVSTWDTTKVTNMSQCFLSSNIAADANISQWNVSNVTNFSSMFNGCPFNGDLSGWNVSNCTSIQGIFQGSTSFNNDSLANWNISNVTTLENIFRQGRAFNGNITQWDTANVTTLDGAFLDANDFNQDISNWNVSNVTDINQCFWGATDFNQDISSWNTSNIGDFSQCFQNATAFNQDIGSWNLSSATDMSDMLDDCGMSTENYSKTLIGWANFVSGNGGAPSGLTLGANNLTYNNATHGSGTYTDAVAARGYLTGTASWTITDGGVV